MSKRMKFLNVWALALVMTGTAPVWAQQTQTSGAAAPAGPAQTAQSMVAPYTPGEAKPPETGGPVLNMTIDEAVNRALERNLNIQVAKLNPQINDYQLQATRAFYRPTFTSSFSYQNSTSQTTQTIEGQNPITDSTSQTYNTGISQQMPWWGGNASFGFNNGRTFTTSTNSSFNPKLSSSVQFNYTQPILQGRRIDSTRETLTVQEITRQVTDLQLKAQIANLVAQVRGAYWDLRSAIEQIAISQQNLDQTHQLVVDNQTRVQVGTMAPLDVVTAEASEATAKQQLQNAMATWQQREIAFKALIVSGTDDDAFKATIDPTDQIDITQVTPDIPGAIAKALAQRTDLLEQQKQLQSTQASIDLLNDQTKPTLNFTGGYSLAGVGGDQLTRSSLVGTVTSVTPGGYGDALSRLVQNPTWNVGLNFSYPIGMVAAKANLARNELSFDQARLQLKQSQLTVATDVTTAAVTVTNSYLALQAATASRQLQEQNAQAEEAKFQEGLSTNYNVIQALTALNQARLSELNAMITYQKALIQYDLVQAVGNS